MNLISKRPKEVTEEDIFKILVMYDSGLTAPQIAKEFKYHQGTVSKIIKDNHPTYNSELHTRNDLKLNWSDVDTIRDLSYKGTSGRKLAEMFNVTTGTISMIINNKSWRRDDQNQS